MSGCCQTVVWSSMHQKSVFTPGLWCLATVRQLYNLPWPKGLASHQGFDVSRLADSCTTFYAPETLLHFRVLMSGNCQTLVRSSIHQIPGFKPAFWYCLLLMLFCCLTSMINSMSWCHVTARQLYVSCNKDLRCVQQSGRTSSIGLFASRTLVLAQARARALDTVGRWYS